MGFLVKGVFQTMDGFELSELYMKLRGIALSLDNDMMNIFCDFNLFRSREASKNGKSVLIGLQSQPQCSFSFKMTLQNFNQVDIVDFVYLKFKQHLALFEPELVVEDVLEDPQTTYTSDVAAIVPQP